MPNDEDSCPSRCLTKGILSLTSSLDVPEGALHPAVATVEATGAHNGVALIIEQQEPQQCEELDAIVPWIFFHLPNDEDSCPSRCLTKGILSLTSSLDVPEGALHPAIATVEATGAHNGVALITEQQEPQQCEEQDTNSIGQIQLQLMLASITDEH